MAPLIEQVRHDAASLYQFVSSITDICESRNQAAAYLNSSERFFEYLVQLARATKTYLQGFPGARTQNAQYLNMRDEIAVLRAGWQFLHLFVKPALDGDTLHLPTALIHGLIKRFHELPDYAETDFVIYHTDEFNYLNVRLDVFRTNAKYIADLVQGPPFPAKFGLIGIPYSQSSSLFMNCLIAHEMGHHVFGDKALARQIRPAIENELLKNLGTTLDPLSRSAVTDMLVRWSEELFCDLFAVRLVGFCFSFAFIELFDICKALDENGKLSQIRSLGMKDFDEYPPHLFRLKQQLAILMDDKWWSELNTLDSHYVNLLQAVEQMKDSDFGLSFTDFKEPGKIIEAFFTVVPLVRKELDSITAKLSSKFTDWKAASAEIEKYLEHGVVPSSLLAKEGELGFAYPDSVTLLNSSYKFYAQSLNRLMRHIDKADVNDIEKRSYWAGRVQMWTAKGIEDTILLRRKGPS